jgi:uncharacterized protein YbjT (DUF2867 family)
MSHPAAPTSPPLAPEAPSKRVLVSGATGYIGGRLVPCLLAAGHDVRCFVRSSERLDGQPWLEDVEVAQGDALKAQTIPPAMEDIDAAYYLIHSLGAGKGQFADRDRRAATNFGRAAKEQGVGRLLYLGGIEPKGDRRSEHLESRLETGRCLRESSGPDVDVTEFRAAVVIGSGSLSFELIRNLTERLPVMICPRWTDTPTQPIAVRDVLSYLTAALRVPESRDEIIEVGGADVTTYADMFKTYAAVRGLRRLVINVPLLTPTLSSHWVGLVTPVTNKVARPLIEGLDNEVTVTDGGKARDLFPEIEPIKMEAAMRLALRRYADRTVPTLWHSALSSSPQGREVVEELERTEGMIKEKRRRRVNASPEAVFRMAQTLGGETGWLYANFLWVLRGYLDLLAGGIGYRKGRRHPTKLRKGDVVDFWRVEVVDGRMDPKTLRLRAEMKTGGRAWLQYEISAPEDAPPGAEQAFITQTAFFEPKGLFGLLYWYALYVPHRFIFTGMIEELGRRAELFQRHAARQNGSADAPLPDLTPELLAKLVER